MKKIVALVFTMALGLTLSFAGPNPKVDICHFDVDDTGVGYFISVNGNSVDRHIVTHGDVLAGDAVDLGDGECDVDD